MAQSWWRLRLIKLLEQLLKVIANNEWMKNGYCTQSSSMSLNHKVFPDAVDDWSYMQTLDCGITARKECLHAAFQEFEPIFWGCWIQSFSVAEEAPSGSQSLSRSNSVQCALYYKRCHMLVVYVKYSAQATTRLIFGWAVHERMCRLLMLLGWGIHWLSQTLQRSHGLRKEWLQYIFNWQRIHVVVASQRWICSQSTWCYRL